MSPTSHILVIDDEPALRQILARVLDDAGYYVELAAGAEEAIERLSRGDIDVALCDIKMPDGNGIDVLRRTRSAGIDTVFVMITAIASVESAVEALRAGAFDYMVKPVRNEELLYRLARIESMRGLREENQALRKAVSDKGTSHFHFKSPAMLDVERLVDKVAPTGSTVLIVGESGTGKGVLAQSIHQKSSRSEKAFIAVNCSAIPEHLLESEFFGHTKGAFTGADKPRKGLFLAADGGTLFLDEVGELPLPMQTKLLHAIEDKQVRAVGSEQARQRGHPHHRRHQSRPDRHGRARHVPRRPVLPPEHVPDRDSAAAREQGRHRGAGQVPDAERPRRIGRAGDGARSRGGGVSARVRLAGQCARARQRHQPRAHRRREQFASRSPTCRQRWSARSIRKSRSRRSLRRRGACASSCKGSRSNSSRAPSAPRTATGAWPRSDWASACRACTASWESSGKA